MSQALNNDMRVVLPERATQILRPRFDFDDAFSDGEDNDVPFELSSAVIREEFAKHHSIDKSLEAEEGADDPEVPIGNGHRKSFFGEDDTSVSTIDIGSPAVDSGAPPPQHLEKEHERHNNSTGDLEVSSTFSHISLSEHPTHHDDYEKEAAPYPHVVIDLSEIDGQDAENTYEAPPISHPQPGLPQSEQLPPTPRSAPNASPAPSTPRQTPVESAVSSQLSSSLPSITSATGSAPTQPKMPRHKPSRSVGPSTFEKVMSQTRPTFLPPKSRQEDKKHMADWEEMMRRSRAAEEKRRKALQERRLKREKRIEESMHLWEREIIPDWQVVYKKPTLRKLWWGGIPAKLRASMWERAVGNALALSKDNYRMCLSRAKRALASGTFPAETLSAIEKDVLSTLPALHIFHPETGPLYQDLKDMLCAWVVSRSDEGLGYVHGVSKIAAMFLINMPPQQGFIVMRNLLERHCMRSFYGGSATREDVEGYYRIFDTLLADGMPKIYFNFKQHHISPALYLLEWLLPLFLDHLPFEACARIWDVLILEGDAFLYRAALGILAVLEARLFFPDRRELLELLRGENKAALEVAKRVGQPMDGGKYEIYGVDEETLWDRIDRMDEWWKESTWTRLTQRELPDI